MSFLNKNWVIQNENEQFNLIAKLLANRGITDAKKAQDFFHGDLSLLHDPLIMKDMEIVVNRLRKAIDAKEKLMIFGDYDVDGITATALLYSFLKEVGAHVFYTLPHRENDGYGLKSYFIDQFKEEGVDLLITVDCGTSNKHEVDRANELGIEVLITDHHSLPEVLPEAVAIVNPHRPDCPYPNKDICGSTIAYKLITAMAPHYWSKEKADHYLYQQLGVVALGIVGDCMALTGENRVMVKEGVQCIRNGESPEIAALLKEAGLSLSSVDSMTLGFQVGPRINAAGRIGHPNEAFDLLVGDFEKAKVLQGLNLKRRQLTQEAADEAIRQVEIHQELPNIIVVCHKDWQAGLLGLVASRLVERYQRPVIAMQEKGEVLVGSMRSVNDFNITENLRPEATAMCVAFGGHAMAGGFTLKKECHQDFLQLVGRVAQEKLSKDQLKQQIIIDCEALPDEINWTYYNKINLLEPFGAENPSPTLMTKNLTLREVKAIGADKTHVRVLFSHQDQKLEGIAFRFSDYLDKMTPNQRYDVVFQLSANEWNGQKKLQLRVIDLKNHHYESRA